MDLIIAVAIAASHTTTYYEAKVTTFGCASIEHVLQLQSIRSDPKAFQMALAQKQLYGQCLKTD